jgi:hypothetical protein
MALAAGLERQSYLFVQEGWAGTERRSYLFVQEGWGDPQAFGVVYTT